MTEQTTLQGSTLKEEQKLSEMFEVLASIFSTPTATYLTAGDGNTSSSLQFQAVTQRLSRLLKLSRQDLTVKQTQKVVMKLTDAEKLAILSNISLKGPLNREYYEEMQRLFLKVKGERIYKEVFGDERPQEQPLFDLWKGR